MLAERDARAAEADHAQRRIADLEDDLTAQLGAEIEGPDRAELIPRLADLESLTRTGAAQPVRYP